MESVEQGDRPANKVPDGSDNEHKPESFEVIIIYNGIKKPLKVKLDESMKVVLQQAIALFGPIPTPHLLSLFTEAGKELPDNVTVKEAGLTPGEKLLLRPGAVKGG